MTCEKGHAMYILEEFKFDHEDEDTPRDTELLDWFKAQGIELGAAVTLWHCEECDYAQAEFEYPVEAS